MEGDWHVDKRTTEQVPTTHHVGVFGPHQGKRCKGRVATCPVLPHPGETQQLEAHALQEAPLQHPHSHCHSVTRSPGLTESCHIRTGERARRRGTHSSGMTLGYRAEAGISLSSTSQALVALERDGAHS